ncbi:MAG TPA: VWA domain-containing protein, partial [Nannocystaceae bacterium]|nr:VWA domain-containing protein [Nannocystaceae bacterium]
MPSQVGRAPKVPGSRLLGTALVAALCAGAPRLASADQLDAEQSDDERGYIPVEELSYEAIVEASSEHGYAATLRVRVALHNTSSNDRDAVLTMALPRSAELAGIAIAKDGVWHAGTTTLVEADPDRRAPGTVWARPIEPVRAGGLPAAEIVAFGIAPESTVQVELELRVFPELHAGRWELELPSRGGELRALASQRRVIVRGLPTGRGFWVDDAPSGTEPVMVSEPDESVTVAWPARLVERGPLLTRYDIQPGPVGFDDGRFRMVLRLGDTPAPTPDHVVFVIDRSRSTSPKIHRESQRIIERMLDALPKTASFDAIGFARTATPLLPGDTTRFGSRDRSARDSLARVLDANVRAQGTDVGAALELAAKRAAETKAKRPLVVLVTDGMLPASVAPEQLRARFEKAAGKHRPELLFVVDDPLFAKGGLPATHPVAGTAAQLGARISLEALAEVPDADVLHLLSAPRVLGELAIDLPKNMTLDDALPAGLVAGNVAVLCGHYTGAAATKLTVRGRAGGKLLEQRVKGRVAAPQAEAFVAVLEGALLDAAGEGFVEPSWLRPRQQRIARQTIEQSGRGRELRGYLDDKIFRNYINLRVLPRARVCYNHALARNPSQQGRITLEMEVGKGEVMTARARSTFMHDHDAVLMACLTEAAWALDVPAAKMDDRVYVVRYPIRLVPPEGKASGGTIER